MEQVRATIHEEIHAGYKYRGPIPLPQELKRYDDVMPGLSKHIIENWQYQSQHRQSIEQEVLSRNERRKDRSRLHALIIALVGMGLAAVLAAIGASPLVAGIIAVISVGGPASAVMISNFFGSRSS